MQQVTMRELGNEQLWEDLELRDLNSRILILENDPNMEGIFKAIVKKVTKQLDVEWLTYAEDALASIHEAAEKGALSPYALIIADIMLDGPVDGIEFWRETKNLFPDTPIVLTSALEFEDFSWKNEIQTSSPIFLHKPFSWRDCRRLFENLIHNSSQLN